ncbi:uncharacterized protein LOC107411581 [Ziziphus jujuba]|uniref:Uncharacterized protein LOC107411581 n=1 Tax=Ziziphus jujuba TaxID=326968 RepID=A0ABM3IAD2_ZIZJJ|nr:uncharacterized protein LOC107411581 [Ziziphus jujuba]
MRVEERVFMFTALLYVLCMPCLSAQPLGISTRSLDALLQDYAFRTFVRPRTGIPYNAEVPHNLTGIKVSAMRLRSGSLRTKGVQSYNEFQIPIGVVEQPFVKRLVLVYHNLGNWSSLFYPLPGYSYLAPVLGLLAYDASNLSAINLPELDLRASEKPILVKFSDVKPTLDGFSPKCVYFDLHGSVEFDNVLPGNACSMIQQGHFSIVTESVSPSPAPSAESLPHSRVDRGKVKSRVWKIVWPLFVGLILLIVLGFVIVRVRGCKRGRKIQQMESVMDGSEALQMTPIGNTKAPLATGTRTRPVLENHYMP